ncbi:MAG TPA: hypothetical protein VF137_11315 [Candidatus Dormibacteraeota bacterium]
MSKFGIVFVLLLLVTAGVALAAPRSAEPGRDLPPRVAINERLTAATGLVLFVLVAALAVTVVYISRLLSAHFLIGLLLIPPVVLKLASTGYKFGRYYTRSSDFVQAGPPPIVLRLLVAPALVIATVAVFVTGVELWAFGLRFGTYWTDLHNLSAVAFMLTLAAHLLARFRRGGEAAIEEVSIRSSRPAFTRRSLLVASLLLGAVLAVASVLYVSPFPTSGVGA